MAEETVDRLLSQANPVRAERLEGVTPKDSDELLTAIRKRLGAPAWRGRGLVIALIAATMLVGVVGGITAAGLGAHTGLFTTPTTETDNTEWLDQSAPDIISVIDGFALKYPLPPGGTWDVFKKPYPHAQRGYVQMTGLEARVAFESSCQWQQAWLDAVHSGDPVAVAAAARVVQSVPSWSIVAKVDGGGIREGFRLVAGAARANDVTEFTRLHSLNCRGAHSPF